MFVFHFLKSTLMQKYIVDNIAGGAQPNLNLQQVGNFYFPLPSITEQKAIAQTLSDTDALITALDALIEKKRRIKQGAMQQLLSGKKRLPGFEGKWMVKNLEEIGKTYGGLSGKSKKDFENVNSDYIPFLNVIYNTIIDTNFFDKVNIKSKKWECVQS